MNNCCDFLYNFAVCQPVNVKEILEECPENHLKSIIECILNVHLFSKCKCAAKISKKLLKKDSQTIDEWRQTCVKYSDKVRFVVALVVRKILCIENIHLLFENYEDFTDPRTPSLRCPDENIHAAAQPKG